MKGSLDGLRKLSRRRACRSGRRRWRAGPVHSAPRRRPHRTCRAHRLLPELRRAQHGRAARPTTASRRCRRSPSGCSPRPGFDVVYPRRPRRALLRPAVREQGPRRDAPNRKSAELEAALREASEGGRLADRVRHQPLRVPDEALPRRPAARCRTASSSSTTRCCRASTIAPQADARRDPSGVQRAQDGHRRQACCASRGRCSAEVVTVDDVLCCGFAGDKGFNRPELNEHALRHLKAALPAGCTTGYSTQPDLRDRTVGARRLPVPSRSSTWSTTVRGQPRPVRRAAQTALRPRVRSDIRAGTWSDESRAVHSLLRRRLLSRSRHRDARAARAARHRRRLSPGPDMLWSADGQQRLPQRGGGDRKALRQELRRIRLHRRPFRKLRAPHSRKPDGHSRRPSR